MIENRQEPPELANVVVGMLTIWLILLVLASPLILGVIGAAFEGVATLAVDCQYRELPRPAWHFISLAKKKINMGFAAGDIHPGGRSS